MPEVPSEFSAWLTSVGLPLGPLAGPLTYYRNGGGKLHVTDGCTSLPNRHTSYPPAVIRTAAQVRATDLCRRCGDDLPAEADLWATVCRHIVWARTDHGDPTVPGSWDRVLSIDRTRWTLGWWVNRLDTDAHAELAPYLEDSYALLAAARARAVATAPVGHEVLATEARRRRLLPPGIDPSAPRIVALTQVTYGRLLHVDTSAPFSAAELLARCQVVLDRELDTQYACGYAATTEAIAALLLAGTDNAADQLHVHDVGPGHPADTPEVLGTAARLLAERSSADEPNPFRGAPPVAELAGLRTAARGIHRPAS